MLEQSKRVLQIWKEKLVELRVAEATAVDPAAKFKLTKDIEECKEKIREIKEELREQEPTERDIFRQYRDQIRKYLQDHSLSEAERIKLKQDAKRLGLSLEEARKILAEETAPLERARKDYEELLEALMEGGCDPESPETARLLKESQQENKLLDWEVEIIHSSIPLKKQLKTFNFETVTVNRRGEVIRKENRQAKYFSEDLGRGIILEMVAVEGGKFMMGTEDEEIERLCQKYDTDWYRNEKPRHQVILDPFYISKYPITQEQWRAVALLDKVEIDLNPEPAHFKGDKKPVEMVTWREVVEWCKRLSQLTGKNYKLPSEAQWEYACRAGTETPFHFGETLTSDLANYHGNYTYAEEEKGAYRQETTPVGQFSPNRFGLYDMHGNVFEWCEDDGHENYEGSPRDGSAWLDRNNSQLFKIIRGGSWGGFPRRCRSAYRNVSSPRDNRDDYIGVRVVQSSPQDSFSPFSL